MTQPQRLARPNKALFHKLAEEIAREWQYGGLTGTMYEEYAEEILVRYLAEQTAATRERDKRAFDAANRGTNWQAVSDKAAAKWQAHLARKNAEKAKAEK